MAVKQPVERKRLVPDPGARSSMAKAVSVALAILETAKQPSWQMLTEAVFAEDPKVRGYLVTLEVDPETDALLAEHAEVIALIRYGAGSVGRKPTTTTILICGDCARWLISVSVSGTPTCVLTVGCTGRLFAVKKATKVVLADPADTDTADADTAAPEVSGSATTDDPDQENMAGAQPEADPSAIADADVPRGPEPEESLSGQAGDWFPAEDWWPQEPAGPETRSSTTSNRPSAFD